MKKIYITRKISEKAIDFLKSKYMVLLNSEERIPGKEEIIEHAKDCDALLSLLSDSIDAEVINSCPKLKVIANYAVGYNNIDVQAAKESGIVVTNTPDVLTDATADLAFALLISAARRIVESDAYVREGKFTMWSPSLMLGQDLAGKTVGILGAGRIGKVFAKRCSGFDMKVLYHNRSRDMDFEIAQGAQYVTLEELLRESDFVSIHVPLTDRTRHLISEKEFSLMKKNAILINTARGPVVDEAALVMALKSGKLWAAGLDVYEREPALEADLTALDNVVLLPHIGSATYETRDEMAMMAARNIDAVLSGGVAENRVI